MRSQLEQEVLLLVEPALERLGFELVDLEYLRESGGWTLRLFIDRPGGITLADCQEVSRAAEGLLDAEDLLAGPYVLEVSSPGVERRLRKPDHFRRCLGEKVAVTFDQKQDGKKKLTGVVREVTEEAVLLEADGATHLAPFANLRRAHLVVDFAALLKDHAPDAPGAPNLTGASGHKPGRRTKGHRRP